MLKNFEKSLLNLKNGSVHVSGTNAFPEAGQAEVEILFADGSKLEAAYWRIAKDGKAVLSSFDHHQQYGLPAPLDAIQELQNQLHHKVVTEALLDKGTGDLLFQFTENIKLHVFNFTGYEIWHIRFPDGTEEYSNHVNS